MTSVQDIIQEQRAKLLVLRQQEMNDLLLELMPDQMSRIRELLKIEANLAKLGGIEEVINATGIGATLYKSPPVPQPCYDPSGNLPTTPSLEDKESQR